MTAASIIDDEIVCKPYSSPQQLLIPSAKGLKLLDLFETFDKGMEKQDSESYDSDESKMSTKKMTKSKRKISFGIDREHR